MIYPKISIVTASFNQGHYLEDTILSVIEQGYPNLEYIIIDGGSTDNSVEIIKKYEKHLTYWVSEKDNGMYDAIQKGFLKSTGELMAWINSDDMYHKKSFYTIAEIFGNFSEINWLMGNPTFYDEQGRIVASQSVRNWSKYNIYLGDYKWMQQESIIWRRSLWEKAGSKMNLNIKYAGDFELWLRFYREEKLYVSSALIGGFRLRTKDQLSLDSHDEYLAEVDKLISEEILDDSTREQVKKIQYYSKLAKRFSRFNIGYFHQKKGQLFEYPPRVIFDRKNQRFELKK